jgi:hypothetical protein
MKKYLVIGLYLDQDPPQRWADSVEAETAEEAEAAALANYDPQGDYQLAVAGVAELADGEMKIAS